MATVTAAQKMGRAGEGGRKILKRIIPEHMRVDTLGTQGLRLVPAAAGPGHLPAARLHGTGESEGGKAEAEAEKTRHDVSLSERH